jgi:tetratricopeptide (TPR) repeat protein
MPQATLNFRGHHHTIKIDLANVSGGGGQNALLLQVPVEIECSLPNDVSTGEIITAKAELFAFGKAIRISETTQLLSYKFTEAKSWFVYFLFPLNEVVLDQIEKQRKDNPSFILECSIQFGYYETLFLTDKQNKQITREFLTNTQSASGQINFAIEQSKWVNTMLAQFGNRKTKIVEIPMYNNIIPEQFKLSMKEFEEAQLYFTKGDYDKAVAHCRAALDPFNGKQKVEKLKAYIKSKSEFDWATDIAEATEAFLEKVIKSTSNFTSKAHHAPSTGHFTRVDAEIIMMITTGVVAYIGKIEYKPE